MGSRPRSLAGWLLLAQAAVVGVLSVLALLLIRWVPDEDSPEALTWSASEAAQQAGAASAVLVVLYVVSAVAGVARLAGRTDGAGVLVAVHLAAALAVGLFGSPVLAAVLALAGLCWAGVLDRDTRRAAGTTQRVQQPLAG